MIYPGVFVTQCDDWCCVSSVRGKLSTSYSVADVMELFLCPSVVFCTAHSDARC